MIDEMVVRHFGVLRLMVRVILLWCPVFPWISGRVKFVEERS